MGTTVIGTNGTQGAKLQSIAPCAICGGTHYTNRKVIWDELAEGWGLSTEERSVVDRQQGTCCVSCGGNLRSIALAEAILVEVGGNGTLRDFVVGRTASALSLLEINEAGTLSPTLRSLPGHVFGAYPDLDMQAMHYANHSFDIVVHSDTLEHVPNPRLALMECARILKPEGALCFTVPVIPGRMSASRADQQPIYHGDPAHPTHDMFVHTDYGADIWHELHQAGFARVTLLRFADGLAITATRNAGRRRSVDLAKSKMTYLRGRESWSPMGALRRATSCLRDGGAVLASQKRSHKKPWPQSRGPELSIGLGSLAAWQAWSAEHA
jgi:SAM-dependent methyltransferase